MTSSIDHPQGNGIDPQCLFLERAAKPEQVRVMRRSVQVYLSSLGWPGEVIEDVTLAVGEAVNNAVCYGEADGDATVSLCCRVIRPCFLLIEVRNRGTFTPEVAELCTLPEGLAVHGRGFALMSTLMDTVQVVTEGDETVVRLLKVLPA